MTPGKRIVLAVLWLGLLGGGLWAFNYYLSGESADAVEKEFAAAWDAAVKKDADGPNIDDFVKRVAARERGGAEERFKSIEANVVAAAESEVTRKFRNAWEKAVVEGLPGPDPAKAVEKLPASARGALEESLVKYGQGEEAKFPRIPVAIDPFSGYCVFRAPEFHAKLRQKDASIVLHDDGGKYQDRIQGLATGKTKMAVFTIDALITSSAAFPTPPASIVFVIDESKGADAVLGPRNMFSNPAALNSQGTKLVFLQDSPSATLARVVKYSVPSPQAVLDGRADYAEVKDAALAAGNTERTAYVLWEPDVAEVLAKNPKLGVITSSKDYPGKIVDVFVVQKEYLKQNPDKVKKVVEAYFETLEEKKAAMATLVQDDAKRTSTVLQPGWAARIADGIAWRERKANFDLFAAEQKSPPPELPIDKVFRDLETSLRQVNATQRFFAPKDMYDTSVLREVSGVGPATTVVVVPPKKFEWETAQRVTEPVLDHVSFPRTNAVLNTTNEGPVLDKAVEVLKNNPTYYLELRGHQAGDKGADEALKKERADVVLKALTERGIDPKRMRAVAGKAEDDRSSSKVVFVLLK